MTPCVLYFVFVGGRGAELRGASVPAGRQSAGSVPGGVVCHFDAGRTVPVAAARLRLSADGVQTSPVPAHRRRPARLLHGPQRHRRRDQGQSN